MSLYGVIGSDIIQYRKFSSHNMFRLTCALWLSVIASISAFGIKNGAPVLKIKNGYIRGIVNKTIGLQKEYYGFRGIPFAEPPVGHLRFEPPVTKTDWNGIWDATDDRESCIQGRNPVTGSEDCLFINVYTPTLERTKQLAVMVWVYGGEYAYGTSKFKDYGPDYFLDKEVIIVTFNYRVGIFGFLSTGDQVIPGNNGMKDHILALRWLQENIKYFGGDPKRVTVFGGSSGGVSVSYLLLSPLAKGLFSRAIMQSGVSLCSWSLSRTVTRTAFEMAKKLGLEANDSRTLVRSLRELNSTYLQVEATKIINNNFMSEYGLIYAPVIEPQNDNAFLTSSSYELLSSGQFINVPVIIGFTSLEINIAFNETQMLLIYLYYYLAVKHLVPFDMNIKDDQQKTLVGKEIRKHYFGSSSIASFGYHLRRLMSHEGIVTATREFVRLFSTRANVFFYRFAYEGGMSKVKYRPSPGAVHSEEISYMWRNHVPPTSELDLLTRERLVTMWTNFAKYANPTPKKDPILNDVIWLPSHSFGDNKFAFININRTLNLDINPEKEDMDFWDSLYKDYAVPPLTTY